MTKAEEAEAKPFFGIMVKLVVMDGEPKCLVGLMAEKPLPIEMYNQLLDEIITMAQESKSIVRGGARTIPGLHGPGPRLIDGVVHFK